MEKFSLFVAALALMAASAKTLDYPSDCLPQAASGAIGNDLIVLANKVLRCRWDLDAKKAASLEIATLQMGRHQQSFSLQMPRIVLADKTVLDLSSIVPDGAFRLENCLPDAKSVRGELSYAGKRIVAVFYDEPAGIQVTWTAELRDESNYIVQTVKLDSKKETTIDTLSFLDATLEGAAQVGRVKGSVVTCGNFFMAVEHPLASNTVDKQAHVICELHRGNKLRPQKPWSFSFVVGVVPSHQLRRGFLYYLERRRAHPYRPFLHYNSWYHLNIGRPNNHMTEAECLATIDFFGRELTEKRSVRIKAFCWDDGWDNFNSLWGFHSDFPNGFKKLSKAGAKYGAAQGVWMSPWGGYGGPKKKRVAYGKSQGYETNQKGFSMAGKKYRMAFQNVCLKMMREHGVVFFKFDGMGGGCSSGTTITGELADDVDSVLSLTQELRRENPELFISATVGTWASPFWTLFADSIWRQGGDLGFYGKGNGRQKWINYRDSWAYQGVAQQGPLYPFSSLMLHGVCVGERARAAKMNRDEKSVSDEIWSFFGSGTNLQELYITPHLMTAKMWDELATAIKWSQANAGLLVDTHWIGRDPKRGQVYGWASWQTSKGIVMLRNPSDKPQAFELELVRDLELPDSEFTDYRFEPIHTMRKFKHERVVAIKPHLVELQPFEVMLFEVIAIPGAKKYDAKAYWHRHAK